MVESVKFINRGEDVMEDRKTILLKACRDLLKKQTKSSNVLDMLATTVTYDDAECDGLCLLEDIEIELERD